MFHRKFPALACAFLTCAAFAADLPLPQPEDLYLTDTPVAPITLSDGRSAIYTRLWVDPKSRTQRQALWRVDDQAGARPLEPGEPDASSPMLSPDGQWIVFLSTRQFPDGTPAFTPVPPYSDPAADHLAHSGHRRAGLPARRQRQAVWPRDHGQVLRPRRLFTRWQAPGLCRG